MFTINVQNKQLIPWVLFGFVIIFFTVVPLMFHLLWNVLLIDWGGAHLNHLNYWQCFAGALILGAFRGNSTNK